MVTHRGIMEHCMIAVKVLEGGMMFSLNFQEYEMLVFDYIV